jgi:hypothetical protein
MLAVLTSQIPYEQLSAGLARAAGVLLVDPAGFDLPPPEPVDHPLVSGARSLARRSMTNAQRHLRQLRHEPLIVRESGTLAAGSQP